MLRFNNHSGLPNVRTGFTNIRKKVIFMAGVFRRSWKRTRSITSRQKQKTTCSRNTLKLTTKFILLKRITSQASQVTYYARKKSCLFKFLWGWAAGFLRPKKMPLPQLSKFCSHRNAALTKMFHSQSPIPHSSVPVFVRVTAICMMITIL